MSSRPDFLHETSFFVDDVEASKSFYQRLFGLSVTLETDGMVGLELPGRATLLLFARDRIGSEGAPGFRSGHDGSGAHHLRFEVPETSFGEWERHLMLNGVAIESHIRQGNGGVSLYFRDPDGHSLEMASSC